MSKYRLTAAKPKNASSHLNSKFNLYRLDETKDVWEPKGWHTASQVTALLAAGHEVRTGKVVGDEMKDGAPVEVELRIAKNNTDYKISQMPDS